MKECVRAFCFIGGLLLFGNTAVRCNVSEIFAPSFNENKIVERVNLMANSGEQTNSVRTNKNPVSPKLDKAQALKAIDNYVKGVVEIKNASEYKEARLIVYGDIDSNGREDAAVQFTVEGEGGGNYYAFYLAVFKNVDGKLELITDKSVGGKLNREVTLKRN
jgi:hypothetical protein